MNREVTGMSVKERDLGGRVWDEWGGGWMNEGGDWED